MPGIQKIRNKDGSYSYRAQVRLNDGLQTHHEEEFVFLRPGLSLLKTPLLSLLLTHLL